MSVFCEPLDVDSVYQALKYDEIGVFAPPTNRDWTHRTRFLRDPENKNIEIFTASSSNAMFRFTAHCLTSTVRSLFLPDLEKILMMRTKAISQYAKQSIDILNAGHLAQRRRSRQSSPLVPTHPASGRRSTMVWPYSQSYRIDTKHAIIDAVRSSQAHSGVRQAEITWPLWANEELLLVATDQSFRKLAKLFPMPKALKPT